MSYMGNRVIAALEAQHQTLIANPFAVRNLNNEHALLIFETSASEIQHASFADYEATLAELFDGKFRCVAGSMFPFEHQYNVNPLMRVVVARNAPTKDYTPEVQAGLKIVSANVFQDEGDDTLWKLVESNGAKRLVQTTTEDFAGIFRSKMARNSVVASTNDAVVAYHDGDYVCFYNSVTAAVDFGFVGIRPDGHYVFSRSTGKPVRILPDQVLECAFFQEPDVTLGRQTVEAMPSFKKAEMVLADTYSWDAYMDYMRTLYGNTDFFKALEKLIKERGVN